MPEKPVVFISCGQCTPDEIALGNEVERFIREETPYEPYFAEQQNTLEDLVSNILSALRRAAAFIGIMHHRGTIATPSGDTVTRGSVWVEQELAICAFAQHVLDRQLAVVLYLQRGISREGIRSQLRLKPVEFDSLSDVLADLRNQVAGWKLSATSTAPLIARWEWKLQPGYTGERHEYKFSVQLYNNRNALIDQWKVELWFPSSFIEHADRSQPFVYHSDADTNYSGDAKRIWPGARLPVFTVSYVVTDGNWPGWLEAPRQAPKVRIRVSTANAQPWEEEISIMDIQKF
jgi:hypothetical protein